MQKTLAGVADYLMEMQKTRAMMQDRVEILSTEPLKVYKSMCKKIKDDVSNRDDSLKMVKKRQKQLDETTIRLPGNIGKISKSQIELSSASQDVTNFSNTLSADMINFEQRRLLDMKSCMHEFLFSSMAYHAKCVLIFCGERFL